jgi:gliding motility-associated-like protein
MKKLFSITLALLLFLTSQSWARHIFGGDFSMTYLGTRGRYQLTLNLFFDETVANINEGFETDISVYVFRKRDHARMESFVLTRSGVNSVVYDNVACAELRRLKTSEVRHTKEVFLDPEVYTDPSGYYIVWERCCRNGSITNIQTPGSTGMVFTLDFPALKTANGMDFRNSSPDFNFPNGDYVCVNKPFTFDMSAKDADGDVLRYSLIEPLAGYTSDRQGNIIGSGASRSTYPTVRWVAGIGVTNMIPGRVPLRINDRTGQLTLTANETGLYVFAVLVEEYRNGLKIGSVRREFQLPVVDCSKITPPIPVVYTSTNTTLPAKVVEICPGATADLTTTTNPQLKYQWKLNGVNLPNENDAVLKVAKVGDYQVVSSFSSQCANDTISQSVKVAYRPVPVAKLTPTDTLRFCENDTTTIQATQRAGLSYEWLRDGEKLAGQTQSRLLTSQSGVYEVLVKDPSFECPARDTVVLKSIPKPIAKITSPQRIFCPTDSLKLEAEWNSDQKGEWLLNNRVLPNAPKTIYAKQAGVYRVRVSDAKCATLSDTANVRVARIPTIVFDSLQAFCYTDTLKIPLIATPAGGTFSGQGLENSSLVAKTVGTGRFPVKYEIKGEIGCAASKTRIVEINTTPQVRFDPTSVLQPRSEGITLLPQITPSDTYQYQWTPPNGLDNANIERPETRLLQNSSFTLTVTSPKGCKAKGIVRVTVADFLFVPEVFSPNNDGINDRWEIKNADKYPELEVFVFNRWGETIFHQKSGYKNPWDGRYLGEFVTPGEYSFLLLPHDPNGMNPKKGSVMVIR